MTFCSSLLALVVPVLPLLAASQEGARLDYRLKVRLRGDPAALESGFRMITTPPLTTRNKVQQPRMGGWRIEPLEVGGALPPRSMLARTLGLCYFSGPTAEVVPLATGLKFGRRWCRLWQVRTPPEVGAYAYLVEVAPNLLALAYLSAVIPAGDIRSVEIHLAQVTLGPRTSPAEEGTALLRTLRHWAVRPECGPGVDPDATESEAVQ